MGSFVYLFVFTIAPNVINGSLLRVFIWVRPDQFRKK